MTHTAEERTLTPAMKIAIGVVGVLVVGGIVTAMVWNGAGRPDATGVSTTPSAEVAPTPGPLPGATATTGSEVPPSNDEADESPKSGTGHPPLSEMATQPPADPAPEEPPLDAAVPLVKAPLPAPASRNGGIVSGFPTRIATAMDDSKVVSTSIATESTVMQVSLVASSSTDPAKIREHYRKQWSALGLVERGGGTDTLAMAGAFEALTLSVTSTGTGNVYTIFGVFKTE
ncbi:hypothetical protein [Microbacterium sp. Bi121]|uniref:hypothetical protein n=1 Tax=Microbacterium sp. Bi121 TaxID=2822348 RepID=UPI001D9AD3AC|nr:hypothetical protein [Microbacterium sp. Bi121]CAH0221158.1 hypothetical protein SRABI121_02975 [Microbacterium sp. Bi121]